MKNDVTMTCPHCGHEETQKICFEFFATGSGYKAQNADSGEWYGVQGSGEVDCDDCGERFLYKLDRIVTCKSAQMPEFK